LLFGFDCRRGWLQTGRKRKGWGLHLIYIDDSRDEEVCAFSAIIVAADRWRESFEQLRSFRRSLKQSDGIFVRKELHAWKFVSGRGRISDRVVTKYRRSRIFREALTQVASLPGVRLANAVSTAEDDERVFEYLANRINRTMRAWTSYAILICDEGKEAVYTRLLRKMGVFNPIPSMLGAWPEGTVTRNIPVELILEDPIFKASQRSYFIQLADFCAYALLRKERPLASKVRYGLDTAFDLLDPILLREATQYDPQGIIRPPARTNL
jgi:hypothetical protein